MPKGKKSMRRGNLNCCVKVCKNTFANTNGDIKFYAFPTAKYKTGQFEEWKHWIRTTNETPNWEPRKGTRICSAHFTGYRTSPMPRSPSYAPSIITRTVPETQLEEAAAIERFERTIKRRISTLEPKDNINPDSEESNISENSTEQSLIIKSESNEFAMNQNKLNKSFQIEMFGLTEEQKFIYKGVTTFLCTQYVRDNICEAQTQVYIPGKIVIPEIVKKKIMKHKCCGPSIIQFDKSVGPDAPNTKKRRTGFPSLSSIENDQEMLDLCGVTLSTFDLLLSILPVSHVKKISKEDRLFLFLTKMKTGMSFTAMSVLYHIHRTTVSRIFLAVLNSLIVVCEKYIQWPSHEAVKISMPEDFKESFSNCRVMINCMKIKVEPAVVDDRVLSYSHHSDGCNTKFLVGYTPSGLTSFVSECYGGRINDCQVLRESGLLDLLEPGDAILADKDYPETHKDLEERGKGLLKTIPPFERDSSLSKEQLEKIYRVARVRIHFERSVQRLKFYKVLNKFSLETLPHAHNIVFMCGVLANLQPPKPPSECKATQYQQEFEEDIENVVMAD